MISLKASIRGQRRKRKRRLKKREENNSRRSGGVRSELWGMGLGDWKTEEQRGDRTGRLWEVRSRKTGNAVGKRKC